MPSAASLKNAGDNDRVQAVPTYNPPLQCDIEGGFADEGKTCTDSQDITPYGTKRQPLSGDPFARAGEKRSLDSYDSRDQQR